MGRTARHPRDVATTPRCPRLTFAGVAALHLKTRHPARVAAASPPLRRIFARLELVSDERVHGLLPFVLVVADEAGLPGLRVDPVEADADARPVRHGYCHLAGRERYGGEEEEEKDGDGGGAAPPERSGAGSGVHPINRKREGEMGNDMFIHYRPQITTSNLVRLYDKNTNIQRCILVLLIIS